MSKQGFFLVARGLIDHTKFRPTGPFSRLEVLIWMLDAATFKPVTISIEIGGRRHDINLARGQFSYSIRYLAKAWRWSPGKVQRFLNEMRDDGTIATQTDTPQMVVTLCNYGKHQDPKSKMDTQADTVTDTPTETPIDTNKKEIKELKEEEWGADAPAPDLVLVHSAREYAFEGNTVRITEDQLEKWQVAYPKIPDLISALQAADDYYTENPPADGKWFFKVSNWLKRDNDQADAKRRQHLRDMGRLW